MSLPIPNPAKVREVLGRAAQDAWETVNPTTEQVGDFLAIFDMARWALDLFEECGNCAIENGGNGKGYLPDLNYMTDRPIPGQWHRCPACDGRGYVLNRERLEMAAEASHDHDATENSIRWADSPEEHKQMWRDDNRAGVFAFLEGMK